MYSKYPTAQIYNLSQYVNTWLVWKDFHGFTLIKQQTDNLILFITNYYM
jgi:hypothetical protein